MNINSLKGYDDDNSPGIVQSIYSNTLPSILLDSNNDATKKQGKGIRTSDISQTLCQGDEKNIPTHGLSMP